MASRAGKGRAACVPGSTYSLENINLEVFRGSPKTQEPQFFVCFLTMGLKFV